MRARPGALAATFAVALAVAACGGTPAAPAADVVVVVGTAAVPPASFAGALHFPGARTPVPSELPALASLLTGRWPRNHGLLCAADDLGAELPTLADALAAGGYRCGWIVPDAWRSRARLARGLESVAPGSASAADLDLALAWLDGPSADPGFVVVHVGSDLARESVGATLARWAAGEGRLAILAGLRGAAAPDDPLRDGSVRVPLALWGAGIAARTSAFTASLVDVPRTVASAVGARWTGRDRAFHLLDPGLEDERRLLVLEAFAPEVPADRQAVLIDGLVLHRTPAPPAAPDYPRLFEDPARPGCSPRDLAPGAPAVVDRLERLFAVWRNGQRDPAPWRSGAAPAGEPGARR